MTKEDYMKLSKERLAELLVERDSNVRIVPMNIPSWHPTCYEGGPCTNPFHDCINCPRQYQHQKIRIMNYEKEYKKLKADIEKAYLLAQTDSTKAALEHILPELRESEDERIRKYLIYCVNRTRSEADAFNEISKEQILAWLEKQGTSYTKRDVDDAYVEGMTFAKNELEKQKPTWSEEDEERFQSCLNILQAKGFMGITKTINTKWLKSLKQRYTWKPSKEQMDAMQMAVSYFGYSWVSKEQKLLESLYKDLKKLTEG